MMARCILSLNWKYRLMVKEHVPQWPAERDLSRYQEYTQINFAEILSAGKTWIDIGCRSGKALSQALELYQAKAIGVNAHKISVKPGIQAVYAAIPEDTIVYQQYDSKVDLLTDIYGAVSYCDNPLDALIYEASLLKPGATAVIVLLEKRICGQVIWQRIQSFFQAFLKQGIQFQRFRSYSDNTRRPIRTLRITITGYNQAEQSLTELFSLAQQFVGQMKKTQIIWQAPDKSDQQWQVKYVLP